MLQNQTTPDSAQPTSELELGKFAAEIGLDWGGQSHAIALRAHGSTKTEEIVLKHSAEALHGWLDQLAERFGGRRVAVAVEAKKGAVVAALLEHPWIVVYPIHPTTSRRFTTAFTPSGAKDDMPDAITLLEILSSHRAKLRALLPQESETRKLSLLVEARRKMVDHRTTLSNELTSLLKGYYPQALQLIGERIYAPLALDFLERWADLSQLKRARPQTLRSFYHRNQVRRPEAIEERLKLVLAARPLTTDQDLIESSMLQLASLVAHLRVLALHVEKIESAIASAFAKHPDAQIFANLPGAGSAMAPRLCALFGLDRNRWQSAKELQTYFGIAPVIEKSGGKKWVRWRWNAPRFGRQTLVEWAGLSVKYSSWANAFYRQQKERGKGHGAALRSLAFKWLRILFRCWKNRKPYDEADYLKRIQERNAPLLAFLKIT